MARQVIFGKSLLNDDVGAGLWIIQTGRHRAVPPINRCLNRRFRECLVGRVRVIDHDDRSTFTGDRCANRGDQTLAALIVRETRFCVLIGVQPEPLTPIFLIPRAFDETPTLDGVSQRKLVGIGCMKKLNAGAGSGRDKVLRPCPCRESHRSDRALSHTGRNVDDQSSNIPIDHRLQVLGNRFNRPAILPRR